MTDLLHSLSTLSTFVITAACAVHLAFFALLWAWARRDLRVIASSLAEFTRDLRHRSVLDATGHLSDQIEAFLADVNDVLADPSRTADREALLRRMNILDERRPYLHSLVFETGYNLCRTMIEAYPLAGVLGPILAIGAALNAGPAAETSTAVGTIVSRFGDAIWSTFAGLTAAIVLMFLNSLVEPGFGRLAESRAHVRETVARAKRELALPAGGSA
ncbi:MAG TPA: MotA/TolQ/ExbB proton channel family protein [Planctomycetaceae bacterium]|nr:MotA/TolQ/ExbB proton channel family protein [Planctomycetaceae bacterium]